MAIYDPRCHPIATRKPSSAPEGADTPTGAGIPLLSKARLHVPHNHAGRNPAHPIPTQVVTIEPVAPDDMPGTVKITWPLLPTVVDPRRFPDTAAVVARMFASAQALSWPEIKARAETVNPNPVLRVGHPGCPTNLAPAPGGHEVPPYQIAPPAWPTTHQSHQTAPIGEPTSDGRMFLEPEES